MSLCELQHLINKKSEKQTRYLFRLVISISAHLWRVGRRALGVEPAAEPVAGALAAVAVEVVHVERRRADAGTALALLVLLQGSFHLMNA